jgi:hypothetical protein
MGDAGFQITATCHRLAVPDLYLGVRSDCQQASVPVQSNQVDRSLMPKGTKETALIITIERHSSDRLCAGPLYMCIYVRSTRTGLALSGSSCRTESTIVFTPTPPEPLRFGPRLEFWRTTPVAWTGQSCLHVDAQKLGLNLGGYISGSVDCCWRHAFPQTRELKQSKSALQLATAVRSACNCA